MENRVNAENAQQQPTQAPWVNSMFSVSFSTPADELSIHLPPIQLPSGITSLIGELAHSQQQNQQPIGATNRAPDTSPVVLGHQRPMSFSSGSSSANDRRPTVPQQMQGQSDTMNAGRSTPLHWGRASSTPATLDSSGSSSGTNDSFVIEMVRGQEEQQLCNRSAENGEKRLNRRHSTSSPNFRLAHQQGGGESQLTQRSAAATASAPAVTSSSETSTDGNNAASGEDTANMQYLRHRLRELFRRRHQLFWHVINQSGEFPSLNAFGILLCLLLVLLVVFVQFFVVHFVASLSLLFAFSHHSDALAFKRFISGQGSGWLIVGKVLLRQFVILSVLGQYEWTLMATTFQEVAVSSMPRGAEDASFWSTLYIVILAQYLAMDLFLCIKLLIAVLPSFHGSSSPAGKRRLYQWFEYTGACYRFAIPFVQWNAYIGMLWFTVLYGGVKLLFGIAHLWGWLLCTLRIFRNAHLGSTPSENDCKQSGVQCTICFCEFQAPIKLKCSHIFCSECIRTWLDREVTCPICRAVVTKEDNHYRNGESMLPCLF